MSGFYKPAQSKMRYMPKYAEVRDDIDYIMTGSPIVQKKQRSTTGQEDRATFDYECDLIRNAAGEASEMPDRQAT